MRVVLWKLKERFRQERGHPDITVRCSRKKHKGWVGSMSLAGEMSVVGFSTRLLH